MGTRVLIIAGWYKAVFSPPRITLENNGKIRPQPDWENSFSRASGGGTGTPVEPSLIFLFEIGDRKLVFQSLGLIDTGKRHLATDFRS